MPLQIYTYLRVQLSRLDVFLHSSFYLNKNVNSHHCGFTAEPGCTGLNQPRSPCLDSVVRRLLTHLFWLFPPVCAACNRKLCFQPLMWTALTSLLELDCRFHLLTLYSEVLPIPSDVVQRKHGYTWVQFITTTLLLLLAMCFLLITTFGVFGF